MQFQAFQSTAHECPRRQILYCMCLMWHSPHHLCVDRPLTRFRNRGSPSKTSGGQLPINTRKSICSLLFMHITLMHFSLCLYLPRCSILTASKSRVIFDNNNLNSSHVLTQNESPGLKHRTIRSQLPYRLYQPIVWPDLSNWKNIWRMNKHDYNNNASIRFKIQPWVPGTYYLASISQ